MAEVGLEGAEGWVQGDAAKQRLGLILGHARKAMTATFVLSAVLNVLLLSGSLYMMMVYDMVLPSGSIPTLVGCAILVLIAYAFQGVPDAVGALAVGAANAVIDAVNWMIEKALAAETDPQLKAQLELIRSAVLLSSSDKAKRLAAAVGVATADYAVLRGPGDFAESGGFGGGRDGSRHNQEAEQGEGGSPEGG